MDLNDVIVDFVSVFPYGNLTFLKNSLVFSKEDELRKVVTSVSNTAIYNILYSDNNNYIYGGIVHIISEELRRRIIIKANSNNRQL